MFFSDLRRSWTTVTIEGSYTSASSSWLPEISYNLQVTLVYRLLSLPLDLPYFFFPQNFFYKTISYIWYLKWIKGCTSLNYRLFIMKPESVSAHLCRSWKWSRQTVIVTYAGGLECFKVWCRWTPRRAATIHICFRSFFKKKNVITWC